MIPMNTTIGHSHFCLVEVDPRTNQLDESVGSLIEVHKDADPGSQKDLRNAGHLPNELKSASLVSSVMIRDLFLAVVNMDSPDTSLKRTIDWALRRVPSTMTGVGIANVVVSLEGRTVVKNP